MFVGSLPDSVWGAEDVLKGHIDGGDVRISSLDDIAPTTGKFRK